MFSRRIPCVVVALAMSLFWTIKASPKDWREDRTNGECTVYSKPHKGGKYREYKVEMTVDLPVDEVWAYLTDWEAGPVSPRVIEHRVLSSSADEAVVYHVNDTSPLKNRDYAMRLRAYVDGDVRRLTGELANDDAPSPSGEFVRVDDYTNRWEIRADGEGTAATFTVYYDPNGRVPARLYHPGMVSNLLEMREQLRAAVKAH